MPATSGHSPERSARKMQITAQIKDAEFPQVESRELMHARTVLVIDAPTALRQLAPRPGLQSIVVTQKRMLSVDMIRTVRPDAVIGPLITPHWDIVDLALSLEAFGFRGNLFALTLPLPRAELVIREVSAVCPAMTVRLLELD